MKNRTHQDAPNSNKELFKQRLICSLESIENILSSNASENLCDETFTIKIRSIKYLIDKHILDLKTLRTSIHELAYIGLILLEDTPDMPLKYKLELLSLETEDFYQKSKQYKIEQFVA